MCCALASTSECRPMQEGSHKISWGWWRMTSAQGQCPGSHCLGKEHLSRLGREILEGPPSVPCKVPGRETECTRISIDLHGGSLPSKFSFPFDQLSNRNNTNPVIILNRMSFTCHEPSISSQLFLCSDLNKGRKEHLL